MRVDHCSLHVLVSEQFLNASDVISVFEKMDGKRMPQPVKGGKQIYAIFHAGSNGMKICGFLMSERQIAQFSVHY